MRFVVGECHGFLTDRAGQGGGAHGGRSFVVLDTAVNHRLIAEYRTEDFGRGTKGYQGSPSRAQALELARSAATTLAARLNG